jgi:hypothetical protein
MTRSTHSLLRAGIVGGVALALMVPATGAATAAPVAPASATASVGVSISASVSTATKHQARVQLRRDLAAAHRAHKRAVAKARRAFARDPQVILARKQRRDVVGSSTDPALILAANAAYRASVSSAAETRAAAIDDARTTRFAAVDAAWAAYDLAVHPANALARNAYRAAMRSARYELRTDIVAAHRAFRTTTAPAHAQLRASINAAIAVFEASDRTPADVAAFSAAVSAARTAFGTDPVVVAARAARHAALVDAWQDFKASRRAAARAFHDATGHWPHRHKLVRVRF